jgi:hypothetical protein
MNWLLQVGKKITSDVNFYYMPKRIVAVIPKTALEFNTVLLNKSEDKVNIYLEFQIKDALETGKDYTITQTGKEITGDIPRFRKWKDEAY